MTITKRIKLNNNFYYIIVDVEYKKHKFGFPKLCLKNFKDDYWDSGDCSALIKKIEESYNIEKVKKYDKNINFMADIIYIYERTPFISGIKELYFSQDNGSIISESFISRKEIKKYIKKFNIPFKNNQNFKLMDERTWKL